MNKWGLFEHFKKCLLREAIEEISVRQRVPVTLIELVLTSPLEGILLGAEPGHILAVNYAVRMKDGVVNWQFNDGAEMYSFALHSCFRKGDAEDIENILRELSDFDSHSSWMQRFAKRILESHPEIIPTREADIQITRQDLIDIVSEFYSRLPASGELLDPLRIALASVCPLNAANYYAVACALYHCHGPVDLLHLSDEELKKMILKLPNFTGAEEDIDDKLLTGAINIWIDVRSDGFEHDDDWDAYA